ncbi:unnamed protein product [Spirodela intermedia]|uniref:Uncharacterized protein n=1 Tax=Spirodela intermedia TaxID=51605 RepID=A0A7I8KYX0_SPIIN|nr:unnamed protein product [Spirodela intermedia]
MGRLRAGRVGWIGGTWERQAKMPPGKMKQRKKRQR